MQQEETRLRSDCHADLVRQLQSRATFKPFFRHKHLHMPEQLVLIDNGKAREDCQVSRDAFPPLGRERSGPQPLASESFALGNFHCRSTKNLRANGAITSAALAR